MRCSTERASAFLGGMFKNRSKIQSAISLGGMAPDNCLRDARPEHNVLASRRHWRCGFQAAVCGRRSGRRLVDQLPNPRRRERQAPYLHTE
jgi:hypothetical protein